MTYFTGIIKGTKDTSKRFPSDVKYKFVYIYL